MFRFKEIALFGWDLWPSVRIPLDREVVIVTGPNGSGKTTLLDAFRQILNARALSSQRRLQHYLRRPGEHALLRAVVSNRGRDALSVPFRRERIQASEVTLACALVSSGGGTPEKRFAVLSGRVDPGELKRIFFDSKEWVGPERYGRILTHAGVTRSLMGVLAIEQGRTNSLFELRPRALFQRVLDMLGDRVVLDRYRAARRQYEDSEREVARQADALSIRQADLQRVLREVSRREEWEQAGERVRDLEARLPAAEFQIALRERREAAAKIPELTTKVRRGDTERIRLGEEVRGLREAHADAEAAHEGARTAEAGADTARVRAERAEAAVLARVEELEARQAEAEAIPPGDELLLAAAAEDADGAFHRLDEGSRAATERIATLTERVRRLEEGLPVWPEAVERCLRELETAGIAHTLVAEKVEPRDPSLAEAVEAALGDARYGLIVEPEAEAAAIEVARRSRFPGPVYAGPRLEGSRDTEVLSLLSGAPLWVPDWLSGVRLSPDGTWADPRGTWTAGSGERVLGAAGRKAALEKAREHLLEARAAGDEARQRRERARVGREEARNNLERERRRLRLLAEAATLPVVRGEAGRLREAADVARAASRAARGAREAAGKAELEAALTLQRTEERVLDQARKLEGERSALAELQARAARLSAAIGSMTPGIAPDLRKRAEEGELDGPDTVRGDMERARRGLESLGAPPPPEVREEARHLQANVEELERHVRERREESEQARGELSECRKRYLDIVAEALRGYRRRVQGLAEIAEVGVEMELPRLADDDRSLDEAEIRAKFGFDGKDPLPVGDPSFSGGQQVIVGLVLLMGMAETDGEGFFMLDEPFAHLSLDRVDQVGRFLRGTRSQFILTAPTTLDRAQLDPASLVVVLGKKRAGEPFAPVPVVAEA